jgi:hypothetical protein
MSKMGSHDPFGYLKHNLWSKERLGVKLPIWLSTIKNWVSPWFTFVQLSCHISLERSKKGLQLWFRLHLNRSSAKKIMGLQSHRSFNFWNFRIPNLGILGQNDIWMQALWPCTNNIIKGKVVAKTSRNQPKCNQSIYDYMRLVVICDYIWEYYNYETKFQLFWSFSQLWHNYKKFHPIGWMNFTFIFIH